MVLHYPKKYIYFRQCFENVMSSFSNSNHFAKYIKRKINNIIIIIIKKK